MRDFVASLHFEWQVRLKSWRLALQWVAGPAWTLVLFAPAMARAVGTVRWGGAEFSYAAYLLPGLLIMNAFVAGQSAGFPLWIDRQTGELEVHFGLPVRRGALLFGRVAGGVASSVLQGVVVLAVGGVLVPGALSPDPWRLAGAIGVTALVAAAIGLLYVGACSLIENQESFNLFINLLNTPLILTSSIYYPLDAMPLWLRQIALVNPLSHGANLARGVLAGGGGAEGALTGGGCAGVGVGSAVAESIVFLAVFLLVAYVGAAWAFRRAVCGRER